MSPLHFEILQHYYVSGCDYNFDGVECRINYAYELAELGLLYTPRDDNKCKLAITQFGRKIFKDTLSHFNGSLKFLSK